MWLKRYTLKLLLCGTLLDAYAGAKAAVLVFIGCCSAWHVQTELLSAYMSTISMNTRKL